MEKGGYDEVGRYDGLVVSYIFKCPFHREKQQNNNITSFSSSQSSLQHNIA